VYLDGKEFKINDESFFPIMLNYIGMIRELKNGSYSLSPAMDYDSLDVFESSTVNENLDQIRAHFALIKEMGFNSIRLAGLDLFYVNQDDHDLFFNTIAADGSANRVELSANKDAYLEAINGFVQVAREFDLKIMLLLPRPFNRAEVLEKQELLVKDILEKFRDEPTIFAYDFFNEPLYFDKVELDTNFRDKKEAFRIVKGWKEMMHNHAPNQLLTIGLSEPIEVFEWDPAILDVDFIAFHTYHPLRVPNEIYWYSHYIDKPWIIGETSLPADNDRVSYLEQQQFMREAYRRVVDCGGSGFGWWHFQDLTWGTTFEHEFTALLNHEGVTYTKDGNHKVYGSIKPAWKEIQGFSDYKSDCECKKWTNYNNIVGYKNFLINGRIVNCGTEKPLEGALIRGWTRDWSIAANTFTREDGSFTLYSNREFVHFEISAPAMSKIRHYEELSYSKTGNHNFNRDSLPDMDLEYHNISHQPFIKDFEYFSDSALSRDQAIFNFEDSMFNQAKFAGQMKTLCLKPLPLDEWENESSFNFW